MCTLNEKLDDIEKFFIMQKVLEQFCLSGMNTQVEYLHLARLRHLVEFVCKLLPAT